MKLGKKLGVVEDPRTFKFRALMGLSLPTPPRTSILSRDNEFPVFGNDQYGCCTCASSGHQIQAHERNSSQRDLALSTEDVLTAYSAITGFDRNRPETDNGAYMLDVLNYRRKVGIGREKDGTAHQITAYVKVNHQDPAEVRIASWLFGGLYVGVWLPITAQAQTAPGGKWDVPAYGPTGDGEPGSWGGHAIYTNGYSSSGVDLITWGFHMRMTWPYWHTYVDECYAVISEDFLRSNQTTRAGFHVDVLRGYLSELGR